MAATAAMMAIMRAVGVKVTMPHRNTSASGKRERVSALGIARMRRPGFGSAIAALLKPLHLDRFENLFLGAGAVAGGALELGYPAEEVGEADLEGVLVRELFEQPDGDFFGVGPSEGVRHRRLRQVRDVGTQILTGNRCYLRFFAVEAAFAVEA